MKAVELFNNWVDLGKDDGMERNHTPSVKYMLNLIPDQIIKTKFSFLDIGCGNGWVVKRISNTSLCNLAVGIDGAEKMISKAKLNDTHSKYYQLNIDDLSSYNEHFDIVFSMEVFYYLKNPQNTLNHILHHLLNKNGCFIMGIDHYQENTPSLKWPIELEVDMWTYSILEWQKMFQNAGFSNIKVSQVGQKNDWLGTLVIYGEK